MQFLSFDLLYGIEILLPKRFFRVYLDLYGLLSRLWHQRRIAVGI